MTYLDAVAADMRKAVPRDALPGEDTTSLFLSYGVLLLAEGEALPESTSTTPGSPGRKPRDRSMRAWCRLGTDL